MPLFKRKVRSKKGIYPHKSTSKVRQF
jgi:hypothetical protein